MRPARSRVSDIVRRLRSQRRRDDETDARDPYRLLGVICPWGAHPLVRTSEGGWTASPAERLAVLLRARDVPVGLVTDGRWWALVWAPRGGTTGVAVWDAGVFSEEPDSLRALLALLGRARFLGVPDADTLPALLAESQTKQEEVTERLGRQVRDAVELLVLTLDRLDADSDGALLAAVDDDELYALGHGHDADRLPAVRRGPAPAAQRRRPVPDRLQHLHPRGALEQRAQLAGEQAWSTAPVPGTGSWPPLVPCTAASPTKTCAYPPTVAVRPEAHRGWRPPTASTIAPCRMLRAAVRRTQRRTPPADLPRPGRRTDRLRLTRACWNWRSAPRETTLGLARPTTKGKAWPRGEEPAEVTISQVASWLNETSHRLPRISNPEWASPRARSRTPWPASWTTTSAPRSPAPSATTRPDRRHHAPGAGAALALRRHPCHHPARAPLRRPSTRRSATGTHYTPRALAEEVAVGALEPLVFRPGPLETADRTQWKLRPAQHVESLTVADIAMGSGAFLVAACRYLADRLVEAWQAEGRDDALRAARAVEGRGAGRLDADAEVEQVVLAARRRIAERCLYGVDINPLAVERPSCRCGWSPWTPSGRSILDDRLVAGDSLLGLVDAAQLRPCTSIRSRADGSPLTNRPVRGLALPAGTGRRPTPPDHRQSVVTVRHVEHSSACWPRRPRPPRT